MSHNWLTHLDIAVTVCDKEGIIIEMNEKACSTFQKYGGKELIGKNLLDCHPGDSRNKLAALLKNPHKNVYTIEKAGIKKMIYQVPWHDDAGNFGGLTEFSLEIPFEMPHFIRQA